MTNPWLAPSREDLEELAMDYIPAPASCDACGGPTERGDWLFECRHRCCVVCSQMSWPGECRSCIQEALACDGYAIARDRQLGLTRTWWESTCPYPTCTKDYPHEHTWRRK